MAIKNVGELIDILQQYKRSDPFCISVADVESKHEFERFFASEIHESFGGVDGVVLCVDAKSNKDIVEIL